MNLEEIKNKQVQLNIQLLNVLQDSEATIEYIAGKRRRIPRNSLKRNIRTNSPSASKNREVNKRLTQ
jgi:hypothetical protein